MPIVTLEYRPPFAAGALLAFLGSRAIPNVEEIGEGTYRRSIVLDGAPTVIEITAPVDDASLKLRAAKDAIGHKTALVELVRSVFDLDADSSAIDRALKKDPLLKALVKKRPGLRVPGAFDGFEMAVRAILGQQISVVAARTLAGRIVQRFGTPLSKPSGSITHAFPSAATIAEADLTGFGILASRARTITELARAVANGSAVLHRDADREEAMRVLRSIRGIGPWTASYIAMRVLRDPNAFPQADLGLLQAVQRFGIEPSRGAMGELHARWQPWNAYAAIHLWNSLSSGQ